MLLLFEWQNLGKPRGRPRDVISFSAAITACQRLSKWQQAIHLLRTSLPDFKIAPDTLCFYGALWLHTKTIKDMWNMSLEMAVLMILQYSLDQDAPSQYHNQTLPFHVWLFEFGNVLKIKPEHSQLTSHACWFLMHSGFVLMCKCPEMAGGKRLSSRDGVEKIG